MLRLKTAVTPYTFVMPLDGSRNLDVAKLPLVEDTTSITKLGDLTGLSGCGNRVYTVVSPKNKITMNQGLKKFSLSGFLSKLDAG